MKKELFVMIALLIVAMFVVSSCTSSGEAKRIPSASKEVEKETLTEINQDKIIFRGGKNTSQTCFDSDGDDPWTYGYVEITYYVNGSPSYGFGAYDGCINNNQYVSEGICNGVEMDFVEYYCENGCAGGKCLNYTVLEPDVDMDIRAYKYQNMDNPEWNSVWARTDIEIDEYDGDGELDMWLSCYANDKSWSSGFDNWIWEPEYIDTNSDGELNLYLGSIEESDFSDLFCFGDLSYGPYSFDEQITSGNIYFPNVDALMIAQEPNTGWQVYLIAHTLGEIETTSIYVEVEYDDGTEQEFDIWIDYPAGTTNIYEMIPINISDNWTEISLYTSLKDYEPYYVRTSAWREYEATPPSPSKTIMQINGLEYTLYEGTSIKLTQEEAIKQTRDIDKKEKLKELASAN